jgi:glutamate synthase (ferredoxin)
MPLWGCTFCCGVQGSVSKSYDIINLDRSALGRVAGAIAKPYGDNGFKGALNFKLTGAAWRCCCCCCCC